MSAIKVHVIPGMGRQGDVLIIPALRPFDEEDLGALVQESDSNRVTLAYGEVTGHAHAFYPSLDISEGLVAANDTQNTARRVSLYELNNPQKYCVSQFRDGVRALRVIIRAFLRHEEHSYHSFPPYDYVVIPQHVGDELGEMRRATD